MFRTNRGRISLQLFEVIKKLEGEFQIPVIDGRKQPTLELLEAISFLLSRSLGGQFSIAQAWQVWRAAYAVNNHLRIKHQLIADVTAMFGLNAFQLSTTQLVSLHANVNRIKAQRRIENQNFDPLDYEAVYNLYLVAYEDEQIALNARSRSMKALVDISTKKR